MFKSLKSRDFNKNSWMFIIAYGIIGMLNGALFDVLVTYLQIISPDTVKSLSLYVGLASLIGAFIMLFVFKLGYKNIMLASPIFIIFSLLLLNNSNNIYIIAPCTLVLITGVTIFDIILPPYLSLNTVLSSRTLFFNRAMYINLIGTVTGTFIGGPIIVWRFSRYLSISFGEAKLLTEQVSNFTNVQRQLYVNAHKYVLLGFVAILCLCLIPIFFIKDSKRSYYRENKKKEKKLIQWNFLFDKFVVMYVIYMILCKFAASLITPYTSLYLSQLGINRASVSVIITAQYFAAFLFMLISPHIVKRIGRVKTLGWMCLASIPFMIIIGSAPRLSVNLPLIIGASLFFRSGFINSTNSVVSSLPMDIVEPEYRPAYNSIIFVAQGLAQGVSGIFTKGVLFKNAEGYSQAYFIAGALFFVAHVLLLIWFTKPYNNLQMEEDKALVS